MPQYDAYMLRIWRSRAVSGRQWVARLDQLPEGESRRFSDPEALLAHLRAILLAAEPATPPADPPPATDQAATGAERGACQGC
jgi:hypothetical protein